jgi:hypothetical protein
MGWIWDERFLQHRLKATSLAGVVMAELTLLLFFYRMFFQNRCSWDLAVLAGAFLVVKFSAFTWYRLRD